jgi:hypothetical protein
MVVAHHKTNKKDEQQANVIISIQIQLSLLTAFLRETKCSIYGKSKTF